MLTIGEFSMSSKIAVKALRLYQEEGILVPDSVDGITGYRYYGEKAWARARVVTALRDLGFSHKEMMEIFRECSDDQDLVGRLEAKLASLDREISRMRGVRDSMRLIVESAGSGSLLGEGAGRAETARRGERARRGDSREIVEVDAERDGSLVCSIRFTGAYRDVGSRFTSLFKKVSRFVSGPPFCLYHQLEHRDGDADIEACVPVSREVSAPGIESRRIEGHRSVATRHYGSYESIGETYRALLDAMRDRGLSPSVPVREVYHKGPGMVFPRDPRHFVTEIRIPVRD